MKLIDLLVKELPRRGGWPEAANYVVQDYDGTVKFSKSIDFLHIKAGEWCSNEDGDDWIYGDRPFEGNFIHHTTAHDRNSSIITRAQYEVALATSEGWIEWNGGECPVDSDAIVEVKYRRPKPYQYSNDRAGDFSWAHDGIDGDIIAYRLQQPTKSEQVRADAWRSYAGITENDDESDLNECIGQDVDIPEWNGEGLPPVGLICEGRFPRHPGISFEWQECLVLYVFERECAVKSKSTSTLHYCDEFRPLRTEAEKAREADIKAMLRVVTNYNKTDVIHAIEQLYDAGYRKENK